MPQTRQHAMSRRGRRRCATTTRRGPGRARAAARVRRARPPPVRHRPSAPRTRLRREADARHAHRGQGSNRPGSRTAPTPLPIGFAEQVQRHYEPQWRCLPPAYADEVDRGRVLLIEAVNKYAQRHGHNRQIALWGGSRTVRSCGGKTHLPLGISPARCDPSRQIRACTSKPSEAGLPGVGRATPRRAKTRREPSPIPHSVVAPWPRSQPKPSLRTSSARRLRGPTRPAGSTRHG